MVEQGFADPRSGELAKAEAPRPVATAKLSVELEAMKPLFS
jgi:hypothetical protein